MNRLAKLAGSLKKSGWDSVFLKNQPYESDDPILKPYSKSTLVYMCISHTSRVISQIPLKKCNVNKKGVMEPLPETDLWHQLLRRPNYRLDATSFIEALIGYLLLDGNVWFVGMPLGALVPASLWIIKRKAIEAEKDEKTGQLIGWKYKVGKEIGTMMLPLDAVGHVWLWNPDDDIFGLSPVEAGKLSIETDYLAARYNRIFFKQGAQPSGILSTEQKLGRTQFDRIKEQVRGEYVGMEQMRKMMVLEQGLAFSQTSITQQEMEFSDLRKYTKEEVLQVFGMKKSVLSIIEDLNFATAKQQKKSWWQDTNLPLMKMIESVFNFLYLGDSLTSKFLFDLSKVEALHEEFSDKVATATKLAALGYTADEINTKLEMGFPSAPWRKVWYMPVNVVPVDLDGTPQYPIRPGGEPGAGAGVQSSPELVPIGNKKKVLSLNKRIDYDQIWKNITKKTNIAEANYRKKVERVFFEIRRKVLAALLGNVKQSKDIQGVKKGIDAVELYLRGLLTSEEIRRLRRESERSYRESIKDGVETVEAEVGFRFDFSLNDPVVINYLAQKTLKVVGIGRTIKGQISTVLQEGVEAGDDLEQIADRIREVFNVASSRAQTIARTEIFGANNFGRSIALNESGFERKVWITSLDDRVRGNDLKDEFNHIAMHGQKVNMDESWDVQGDVIAYPGDYTGDPANIINCRCVEVVDPESHPALNPEEE